MPIEVSAFRWVPPFAQGYVRDLRVRWALEEAALTYQAALVDQQACASAGYRQWQPFGQVPAYRDGQVELFESGAIVLHIAAKSEALAPADEAGRARTTAWVIAALNSVEPYAQMLIHLTESRAQAESLLNRRLEPLEARPAFGRALEAQMQVFRDNAPANP